MLVIPAIDIKSGRCVRLKQGMLDRETVFSENPVEMADDWLNRGARRIHLVDLDGAFDGKPRNLSTIREILKFIDGKVPVQVGGGIRSLAIIDTYLNLGATYVILGTVAVNSPELVEESCRRFAGKIYVGIDSKDGKVSVSGWARKTSFKAIELAKNFEGVGVGGIIYTDINRDGMGQGLNVEATKDLSKKITIPVIASGGLKNMDDIRKISECEEDGIIGVIAGTSLYKGYLDLRKAQTFLDNLTEG